MNTKLVFAVVTAGALLGASGFAFAQAGLDNGRELAVPQYDTFQRQDTTGSVTDEERQVPRNRFNNSRSWQGYNAPSRTVPEPIVPLR